MVSLHEARPDSLHDDEACWIALTAKLRACHRHGNFIGGVSDWVTFLALQPLTDALAALRNPAIKGSDLPALTGEFVRKTDRISDKGAP